MGSTVTPPCPADPVRCPGSAGRWPGEGLLLSCAPLLACSHSSHLTRSRRPLLAPQLSSHGPGRAQRQRWWLWVSMAWECVVICPAGAWSPFSQAQVTSVLSTTPHPLLLPLRARTHPACFPPRSAPHTSAAHVLTDPVIERVLSHVVSWPHCYRLENQSCPFGEKKKASQGPGSWETRSGQKIPLGHHWALDTRFLCDPAVPKGARSPLNRADVQYVEGSDSLLISL